MKEKLKSFRPSKARMKRIARSCADTLAKRSLKRSELFKFTEIK